MPLEDKFEYYRYKKLDMGCPYINFLATMSDPKDRQALEKAVNNGLPATTICKALRAEGYKLGEISINEHRRGVCRCQNKK
jgi:hypothetical protein